MKLLTFQTSRFSWTPYAPTLDSAAPAPVGGEVGDAVVVFAHVETHDALPDRRNKVFRKTLKHVKWLANKRSLSHVVLHSFAHLGGESGDPEFARELLDSLAERLRGTGYIVDVTPFGWFCSWEIGVYGESLAKVWKEI